MLKDNFYRIIAVEHEANTIAARIEFCSEHPILAGHFPGQPVVPGACLLQIVKEVLNDVLSAPYRLKTAENLKFIAPIDPRMADDVELNINYKLVDAGMQVTGVLTVCGVASCKIQGVWVQN